LIHFYKRIIIVRMAFARLFGKNKKDPTSPDQTEREGEEGFTVVESRQAPAVQHGDPPSVYPSISTANLPYMLPGGPPGQVGGHIGQGSRGAAKVKEQPRNSNPMDGVHFSLSPRLTTDTEVQYMVTAVDSVMDRLKKIEWGALEYNFSLERSVLGSQVMAEGKDMEGLTINSQ